MSKFVRFEVDQVVVPAREEAIAPFAAGGWDHLPIIIVRGITADGMVAYGEAERGISREDVDITLRALLHHDLRGFHPASNWEDAIPQSPLPSMLPDSPLTRHLRPTQTLVETLWLDAIGKLTNLPAHALLGGKIRNRVRVDAWANRPSAKTLAILVEQAATAGFTGMKLKCDAAGDMIHALSEIAASVPTGFDFTVDPMCALGSFSKSVQLLKQTAQLPFAVRLEDPFSHYAPAEWHRARQAFPVPLIWHGRSLDLVRFALREGFADGYNVAGAPAFGFLAAAGMIAASPAHCWHGASLELGITQAARLHACAVAPACELSSDLSSFWVRKHTLLTENLPVHNGTIPVPDQPGLGICLDEDAVAHYRVAQWRVE